MPLNRELLASLTFEPPGVSDDSGSDGDMEPAEKLRAIVAHGDEDSSQNEATKLVIHCLKLALAESIISISHPEKQRPLNPKSDFSIQAMTVFTKPAEGGGRGGACCGSGDLRTKSRRRAGADGGERRRQRRSESTSMALERWMSDAEGAYYNPRTSFAAAAGSDGGGMSGGTGIGGGHCGDTASARLRRRRTSSGVGGGGGGSGGGNRAINNDAATVTEDDEYDEEGDDAPPVNFKFTDFSPMCYRHIREFFGVDPKEYCDVLRYSRWHSIPTPGKSAAQLFFCGRDWVIKTMTNQESEFLREILHRYYYHVRDNPYTLLPHFVGHHRLEIGTESHNFIIMQNVFATTNTIHEKFDLKGSTIGRYASEAEKLRATCTQKDLDIHRPLHVGPERRQLLIDQVKADCDFLKRSKIMDYSFLVGIHILPQRRPAVPGPRSGGGGGDGSGVGGMSAAGVSMSAGGADSLANTFTGGGAGFGIRPSSPFGLTNTDAGPMTSSTFAAINTAQLLLGGIEGTTAAAPSRHHTRQDGRCVTADQGGMMSNDVSGLRKEIYYIGIIDILQEYNARKKLETAVFGTIHDFQRISCVNPSDYATRFIAFMTSIIV